MSVELIVGITIILLIALLISEVPVAFSLGTAGTVGVLLLDGAGITATTLARIPFQATSRYSLVIVPMFIFMGLLAMHGGLAEDVFRLGHRLLGRLPGGLGLAAILASAAFAAVSGSSVATVATVGRTSIAEMRKYGYDTAFAAGIVGAAGTLGVLIPPSVVLVLYGIITGESIGALLIAGIIPGLLSAVLYAAAVVLRVTRNPSLVKASIIAPPAMTGPAVTAPEATGVTAGPSSAPGGLPTAPIDGQQPIQSTAVGELWSVARVGVLFAVVVGGIYTGLFTATESAALGGFAALLMITLHLLRRSPRALLPTVASAARESASVTSMIFAILVGASLFTFFLVRAGVPTAFTNAVLGIEASPLLIVILLLLMMIPLGMALDPISILLISVPLAHPVITELGFDGLWFGILTVKMIELGLITPPVGLNAYVVAGCVEGVTVEQAFKGLSFFFSVDVLTVVLLIAFPAIVTWLPAFLR
ncbi:TRAP transporter large permease [soil metagenome]